MLRIADASSSRGTCRPVGLFGLTMMTMSKPSPMASKNAPPWKHSAGLRKGTMRSHLRAALEARQERSEALGAAAQRVDALAHQHELHRAAAHADAERLQAGLQVQAEDFA